MSAPVRHLPVVGDAEALEIQRPRTRGECAGGERPCPWVSCEHHAIHGVLLGAEGHALDDDGAVAAIETMAASCTLDVADQGGAERDGDAGTLGGIGALWGVSRERIRQIEAKALKAIKRAASRVRLRDDIVEEPETVLRPRGGGSARPVEDRRRVDAPAQHAALATPETVTEAAQGMWCPWMGAAMTGGLCARRHAARTQGSASAGGNPGTRWPTYPGCASCADGAAVAARLGAVGELVPLRVAVPARAIDWMGDGESPANDRAPAAMGAEEDDVSKTKAPRTIAERVAAANAARVTTPAAGARCSFPGCTDAPIPWRASLDAVLRPFCKAHRTRAQSIRCVRKLGAAEAVAVLLAGAGKQHATRSEIAAGARAETPAPRDSAELAAVRQDRDDAHARLAAALMEREQIAQRAARVEGELAEARREAETLRHRLADEMVATVASPWARLDRLARVLRPEVAAWALFEREGRWMVGGYADGEETLWEGEGATPDEALAALVAAVEGEATARVEAIRAALEGRP